MDEDEWMYEIMSERADMDYENAESCGANESHVDCSDAFKTSQVIMLMLVTYLMNTSRKLKLCGFCRCLSAERMFCGGLDPWLMKTDLWR